MIKTVNAKYNDSDAVKNAFDDLINHGIEREKIFVDNSTHEIKVMIHEAIEPEISEILSRHHPA